MKAVMLDTNVFDKLLSDVDLLANLPRKGFEYYATTIQYQQICNMPKEKMEKQAQLKSIFSQVIDKVIEPINNQWLSLEGNFFGKRFCSEEEFADLKDLRRDSSMHQREDKNKGKHLADALIILTAKFSGNMIVVSEESSILSKEAKNKGYRVYSLAEFITLFE
ncbi:MAG: hypothetical protein ABSF18_07430 [Gammaproteobacteria bacterium]